MSPSPAPVRRRGQTLIIALLVLGVLLILSAVFAGILNRAIRGASLASGRATASDFAEGGIRYAHGQLLGSELGADWRGIPTTVLDLGGGVTRDPDAYYLRPPAAQPGGGGFAFPTRPNQTDQGGPDGLGSFFRVNFDGGRALVRVRYAPGDPTIFSGNFGGPDAAARVGGFLQPGRARNYLVIESVGRLGSYQPTDPTSGTRTSVRFTNFASQAAFNAGLDALKLFDANEPASRRVVALAQIGLIDTARFITNKDRVGRPAEIGAPREIGARDANGTIVIPTRLGGATRLFNVAPGGGNVPSLQKYPGLGSLFSNADVRLAGDVGTSLNATLGDSWAVAGTIAPADGATALSLETTTWNGTAWVTPAPTVLPAAALDSSGPAFSTQSGLLRDGGSGLDANGFPRGVGRKEPPTILGGDRGPSRYVSATRETGDLGAGGRRGVFGHGEGVYVDNRSDFQASADEAGREIAGSSQSLEQDWLSPFGDGVSFRSGWRGPFYIPVGATVRLQSDGFTIAKGSNPDAGADERTWKDVNGADSGLTTLRYRIGLGTDGQPHVMDTLTAPLYGTTINAPISAAQYQQAPAFDGVLYFEGNVRVRGVIPTDVQLTLVTNRTAYIEGSILKGTVGNEVTRAYPVGAVPIGQRLTRRSRSTLMIMAKDYVALNTTMFFGPTNQTNAQAERGANGVGGYNPVRLAAPDGEIALQSEMPLAEVNDDPSLWRPLALDYVSYVGGGTGTPLASKMLLTQTLEATPDGPSATFVTLGVNDGEFANPEYNFEVANSRTNGARAQYAAINAPDPPPAYAPIYGLGLEPFQQSSRFETIGFPLLTPGATNYNAANGLIASTGAAGAYTLTSLDSNAVRARLTSLGTDATGSYLLGRAAIAPNDVRIEASIYAQEGSFFVIPGDWFNANPNDTRAAWIANGGNAPATVAAANEKRLVDFGTGPDAPFYGEPLDVRVEIVGSVSENMPPPVSVQGEWLKKWGWIPLPLAALSDGSGNALNIPASHVPATGPTGLYVPNLTFRYDPVLATGRVSGFSADNVATDADRFGPNAAVRYRVVNGVNVPLPPMPRLPVSPTLAYFGEVK